MARVSVTYENHIAHVTLTRGDKMNALDREMFDAIVEAGQDVAASDARVCVLSGEGKAFCAGLDLASFAASGDGDPTARLMERAFGDTNRAQEWSGGVFPSRSSRPCMAWPMGAACNWHWAPTSGSRPREPSSRSWR